MRRMGGGTQAAFEYAKDLLTHEALLGRLKITEIVQAFKRHPTVLDDSPDPVPAGFSNFLIALGGRKWIPGTRECSH